MDTIAEFSGVPPIEPWNLALPKLKTHPVGVAAKSGVDTVAVVQPKDVAVAERSFAELTQSNPGGR